MLSQNFDFAGDFAWNKRLRVAGNGLNHAGCLDGYVYGGLLCTGIQLRGWLPEVEVEMTLVTVVVLVLSVLLLGYLTATLLFPEKF